MQQAQSTRFLRKAKATGRWIQNYWWAVLLSLGATLWIYARYASTNRNQRAKYTIGFTTGDWNIGRSGVHYIYKYKVNSVDYESADVGTGNGVRKGTRFVVKYDSLEPDISLGYFEYVIPDSIHQTPPNGWLKPPFFIPQWVLDRNR